MKMTEEEVIERLKAKFSVEGYIQRKRRVWIFLKEKRNLLNLCKFLREISFFHLSAISTTDWVKEGTYEVAYHLWSYKIKLLLTIKVRIDRDFPEIDSVCSIWGESAQIHERESAELFGVKFVGNPDLSPLFLEGWSGPPPFRKDFDWRDYVRERFYSRENEREVVYYD
ncbi:MAG: NADH-quinone oxidoreductase subunit C [Synergistetes bacterium]|nr:NADH-quinone oxidoreductase subunit C [Synergistota bacterium]